MYISINKKLLLLTLIFVLPLTIFASSALNIMVFGNSGNTYFIPVTAFSLSNGYVNYTDILGREHQFSSKYLMLIYSSNSKTLLDKVTNSMFGDNGKIDLEFPKKFPDKISKSYSIKSGNEDYKINYDENNNVSVNFNLKKEGKYSIELSGVVKDFDFSAFKVIIDRNEVPNIFSNNLFFFLNEKNFAKFEAYTASTVSLNMNLKAGKHTIKLIPQFNNCYLFIKNIHLSEQNKK